MKKLKELFLKNKKLCISLIACGAALVFMGGVFGIIALSLGNEEAGNNDVPAAHEHKWDAGEAQGVISCTEDYEKLFTCTVEGCDETRTETVKASGHTGGTATCLRKAVCSECGETYGELAEHKKVVTEAVKASCTTAGSTEGSYCSVCQNNRVEAKRIAPLGHTWVWDEENKTDRCEVCNLTSRTAGEDLEYRLVDKSYYMVVGIGNSRTKHVVIPTTYNNLPVKAVDQDVFQTYSVVESFETISADMHLEGGVFRGCTQLKRVVIGSAGEGVTEIDADAFKGCTSLEEVVIGDSVKRIGYATFEGCKNLKYLTLGKNVESIEKAAFKGCTNLVEIKLPAATTYLGAEAFASCTKLESVVFGEKVEAIENNTFEGCTALKYVEIPDSVTVIGEAAFKGCTALENIAVGKNVTSIGKEAFANSNKLESIEISDAVVSISADAFVGCSNLKKVNVSSVAKWTEITFENGWANPFAAGAELYLNGTKTTEVVIPDEVTAIKEYAFSGYKTMTKVVIGKGVKSIGSFAFSSCSGLKNVEYLAVACANTEGNVFYRAGNGINVTVGAEVTIIPNRLFFTEDLMFAQDEISAKLEQVTFVAGGVCESIGEYAFATCYSLKKIDLGDSVTTLENNAFADCVALTEIVIPETVTLVGGDVFASCKKIEKANVPAAALSHISKESLKDLTVSCGNVEAFVMKDALKLETVVLGANVTDVGTQSFYNCPELVSVDIQDSVTVIGTEAFASCVKLTTVDLGNKLVTIDDSAFADCESLANITWSEALEEIGYRAFFRCLSLKEVTITANVKSIEREAFASCRYLAKADFKDRLDWYVAGTMVDSSELADPAKAAGYLRDTFAEKDWVCKN